MSTTKRTAWKGTHPKRGKETNGAGSTVLDKGTRDDLQGLSNSPVRPLLHTSHGLGFFCQGMGHSHLFEENGTGLGVFTLSDKCKVLVSNFLDFQQICFCSNIIFSQFFWSADYPGPQALSMQLLSVFSTLRMAVILVHVRECWAKSEVPFSVMTTLGFIWMSSQNC